jgi:hypothetical protein
MVATRFTVICGFGSLGIGQACRGRLKICTTHYVTSSRAGTRLPPPAEPRMHFWSRSAGARVRGVRWPGRRGETAVALSVGALPAARPNPKPGSSEPRRVSAPASPVMTGSPLTAAFDWLDDWQMSRRSRWPTRASWRPPTELLSPAVPMELSCSRGHPDGVVADRESRAGRGRAAWADAREGRG